MDNSKCFSCGANFTETDRVVYCPTCNTYYHESCWINNNGCTNPSCSAYVGNASAHSSSTAPIAEDIDTENAVFNLKGARGRRMLVFEDRVVISVIPCFGSFFTGSLTYGEKTIYFKDCIGIQFKRPGFFLGYLLLETAGPRENRRMFTPNSFCFQLNASTMEKVYTYIKEKIDELKK